MTTGGTDYSDRTIVVKMPGTGMTIFNRYKLERVLGRGGMGVVWLADDLKLERPVALKFLPSLIGLDPAAVKELKTETRRGLELSHPHIVRIYDFVDDEDAAAISMEFVDGKTLSELRLATEGGVFTTEEVSKWLLGVCDALDYAHFQRKVVHRDLKPANIMITTKDAVAKVADFGIARSLSDTMSRLSAANMGTSGTLPYMSPQQAMGERPLPTDDVYSLGATLYELFTGKPPFYRGDLPMQINSKIPPSVAERRKELDVHAAEVLPKLWEDAIAACLSKDPNQRPSCAGMLAEMLELKVSTGTSRTVSFANTQRGKAPQTPAKSSKPWIGIAAAVAVFGGGAAFFLKEKPAEAPPVTTQKPAEVLSKPKATPDKVADAGTKPKVTEPAPKKAPEVSQTKPAEAAAPTEPAPATKPVEAAPAPAMPSPAPVAVAVAMAPANSDPASATLAPAAATVPPASLTAPVTPPAESSAAAVGSPPVMTVPAFGSAASIVPTPSAAPPGMLVAAPVTTAAPPPVVTASVPLPPGYTPTPDLASQLHLQPIVADPPSGFWTVEQIFPTVPFTNYSAAGKRYLLYRAQTVLKEKSLYTSTVDGKEGKGTHNAIQLFQAKSGLRPTGLLDVPTLAALNLSIEPDNLAWTPPSSINSGSSSGGKFGRAPGGGRYTPQTEEQPNRFKRALDGFLGN
jgi:serine/threonine protein kinase